MQQFSESQPSKHYTGPERRIGERRSSNTDRRELVRYELDRDPRRKVKDRRKYNGWDSLATYAER